MSLLPTFVSLVLASVALAQDPCTAIAGKTWVSPADVRACYTSFPVIEEEKANIIEVINKTIAFHTSTNYQIQAPAPFDQDVHENLYQDLARISGQSYDSYYNLHFDLSRTFKRLQDGHCTHINYCFDSAFVNYLPTPVSLITEEDGSQAIHIAYEAFNVSTAEFKDEVQFWQDSLPDELNGQLASLSGAKIVSINGADPFDAVEANAAITGSYQSKATRQNSFFSSYQRSTAGWNYLMGNFAQQTLPLADDVTLEIIRANQTDTETVTIPYRSRIGAIKQFTDGPSYLDANCRAVDGTNGADLYATGDDSRIDPTVKAQSVPLPAERPHKLLLNTLLDATPASNVVLPPGLVPGGAVDGSFQVAQFYMLNDTKTGVLALGSFSVASSDYNNFLNALLDGLVELKGQGATQLVVDVSNNGGGFICAAHWLHRIIVGPKSTSDPQAGLNTTARAGPLAKQIVEAIISEDADPSLQLLYNPLNWNDINNIQFDADENWLEPSVNKTINGYEDAFSQTIGQECAPSGYPGPAPDEALFDGSKVAIVSNGRCASSCSLFSITMAKLEGSKTAVIGGKADVQQNYCGTVGGQSTDFSTIDTEIKTAGLKNNTLAPPDLIVNAVQGITWRLGYGIEKPDEPEEWQEHDANLNLAITPALANNPAAIWEVVAEKLLN